MDPILYLAPIQGITDQIYRNIFPKHFKGFDCAVSPFIATSSNNKLKGSFFREFDPKNNRGIKTIPQILSKDPEDFIALADTLNGLGYEVINWNLGCPFPAVVNKGKGSGMLCHPGKIVDFLDHVMNVVKSKISIKLRLGLVNPDEILGLIPLFNNYPLQEIIIHPRTGRQMYDGTVDLEAFEKCLAISKHTVVYNGDIDSLSAYTKLRDRFAGINKWMIGRGVLRNPFLAEEIKSDTVYPDDFKREKIIEFHDDLFDEYSKILSGPSHMTDKMKGVWLYLADSFADSEKIKKKINKTHSVKSYLRVLDECINRKSALE